MNSMICTENVKRMDIKNILTLKKYTQPEGYGVYKTDTQAYLVPLYSHCTIDPITMENGAPTLNIGSVLAEYSTKHGFTSTFGNDSLFVIKD